MPVFDVELRLRNGVNANIAVNGTKSVIDGAPHLVGLVINRSTSTAYLYVDGALDASVSISGYGAFSSGSTAFGLGSPFTAGSTARFVGTMDEAFVLSRALSVGEMEAIYLSQREFAVSLYAQGGRI